MASEEYNASLMSLDTQFHGNTFGNKKCYTVSKPDLLPAGSLWAFNPRCTGPQALFQKYSIL